MEKRRQSHSYNHSSRKPREPALATHEGPCTGLSPGHGGPGHRASDRPHLNGDTGPGGQWGQCPWAEGPARKGHPTATSPAVQLACWPGLGACPPPFGTTGLVIPRLHPGGDPQGGRPGPAIPSKQTKDQSWQVPTSPPGRHLALQRFRGQGLGQDSGMRPSAPGLFLAYFFW